MKKTKKLPKRIQRNLAKFRVHQKDWFEKKINGFTGNPITGFNFSFTYKN